MSNESKLFRGSPQYYERIRNISLGDSIIDFISLNMPPVCNYRCECCLSGMNSKQAVNNSLTRDEIQSLILNARTLGALHIEVSGEGEPLIYQGMLENIISLSSLNEMHTTIFTNGSLLTEEFLKYLCSNDVSLAISLDYLDKNRYENFTGSRNSYERVLKNIELAREIFREKIFEDNNYKILPLAIHATITADNSDYISQIGKLCSDDIFFSVESIMNRGDAQENSDLLIADNSVNALIDKYSNGSLIVSDTAKKDTGTSICGTFYYGLGIRYDGEVLFDAHAYDTAGLFGNIRSLSLSNLIQNVKNAQDIYFEKFNDGGFCPLRNPDFSAFVQHLRK
ncbi:MAG: radical SAM protein [Candidatus Woesearchaeota archaeon]